MTEADATKISKQMNSDTGLNKRKDRNTLYIMDTGSSCLMRISLLLFFKTITKIWLMRFYGLFILLLRT